MKRYLPSLNVIFLALICPLAQAQLVTQSTQGIITNATGPLATLIGTGEPVTIEYTFDTSVADMMADPAFGFYDGAVVSLSVTFDDLGLEFENADSLLYVLDDYATSTTTKTDSIIVFPGDTVSTEMIADMEVELGLFMIETAGPSDEPLENITSDAVPDYPIDYSTGRLGFELISIVEATLFEIGIAPSSIPESACSGEFKNHGQYVSCVAKDTNSSVKDGTLTGKEKGRQQRNAAKSR